MAAGHQAGMVEDAEVRRDSLLGNPKVFGQGAHLEFAV
jgi:hypothetical protein